MKVVPVRLYSPSRWMITSLRIYYNSWLLFESEAAWIISTFSSSASVSLNCESFIIFKHSSNHLDEDDIYPVETKRIYREGFSPYQWRHREPDNLDVSVVVSLRFKVVMFSRISPRCGAGTIPANTHKFSPQVWNFPSLLQTNSASDLMGHSRNTRPHPPHHLIWLKLSWLILKRILYILRPAHALQLPLPQCQRGFKSTAVMTKLPLLEDGVYYTLTPWHHAG